MTTAPTSHTRENPARVDESVGTVEFATPAAVDRTVRRAALAQVEWAARPLEERVALVRQAADHVEKHLDEIAGLVARETGKVLGDSRGESAFAVAVLRHYANRAPELLREQGHDDERGRLVVRHRPFGVVGAITPWNAPIILAVLKVAPALVSGNTIVVKPSPLAPFGIQRFLELAAEVLPAGVVDVVQGDVETVTALVEHPGISRVAFTGGDTAGRAIASLAGRSLTPSVLELGGNDAAILLDDVALTDADAERLVMAAFATSGQVCMAIKRLYVHSSRLDEVVAQMRAAAERVLLVGDPLAPDATVGPVVNRASRERLEALVQSCREAGNQVIEIGGVAEGTDLDRGHFVRPVLVLGADDSDVVVAQEQFGPVLPIQAFDEVDEVVVRANAGDLGLGASVWSADEERAFAVAARLEAGFTFVNTHNRTGMSLLAPFGGVKRSGWGREYGDEGLMEYVQPCVIHAPGAFREGGAGSGAAAYPGT
ncbi:aldehyde dehydrogenase family protein [Nocardioides jishulii]|uniref:Aldehyde dehydrogenase family protein n=1 Tax=Nocardioides jishulii TaxID=2575440 RepID=A0A4U2YME8_9ACTN|nr:aldehyde dehydrogenase family protein [Nocardioides jishulii]QCX27622.1 aldehyde dehydrogenase family protein [Nocardioides jishulii]TKI62429.1 aldehyde dehydrogenase family protein [Nocardioides jishulii]